MTTLINRINETSFESLRPLLNEHRATELRPVLKALGIPGGSKMKKADAINRIVQVVHERRAESAAAVGDRDGVERKAPTKSRKKNTKPKTPADEPPTGYRVADDDGDWGWFHDETGAESDVWFDDRAAAVADAVRHASDGHVAETTPTAVEHDGRTVTRRMLTTRLKKLDKPARDALVERFGLEVPKRMTVREIASALSAAIVAGQDVPEVLHESLKPRERKPRRTGPTKADVLMGLMVRPDGVSRDEFSDALDAAGLANRATLYIWRLTHGVLIDSDECRKMLWVKGSEKKTRRYAWSEKKPGKGWTRPDAETLGHGARRAAKRAARKSAAA